MLGDNRDIVRAQTEVLEGARQRGIAATTCCRQGAEAGGGDRGVRTVCEGTCVGDNRLDRQAQIRCNIAAGDQQSATAGSFEEARATTVSGAREVARSDSTCFKRCGLSGRVHVAKAGERFD